MSGMLAPAALGLLSGVSAWLLLGSGLPGLLRGSVRRWRALEELRRRAGGAGADSFGAAASRLAERLAGLLRLGARRGREGRERAALGQRCTDELPELIDVIALGLSAGVSFDTALAVYCEHYRTGLAALLGEAMQSWRLGMTSRREALRALSDRLGVGAFTTFCETVTESLDFGVPLAKTLAGQAEAVRLARRAAVEEQIEKAPVKMLVPTGTLVLPAMLLAIVGPLLASLSASPG